MFRTKKIIVLFVFTSLLLFPPVVYAKVGSFNQILGTVEQLKEGKPPGITPQLKDGVGRLDVVNTHAQSRAEIILLDNSVLTVAPGSHVTIEQYLFEEKNQRNIVINLVSGFLDVVVTKASPKGEVLIKTSTATMGIRGSWAKVAVKGNDALFAMMSGTGTIKASDTTKKAQLDKIGKVAYTLKSSDPTPPGMTASGGESKEFILAQAGAGGGIQLSPGSATTVVGGQVSTPAPMTVGQMVALIQASTNFMANNFVISRNVSRSIGSVMTGSTGLQTPTGPTTTKAMTQEQAKTMAAGIEAKFSDILNKDKATQLTADQAKAIMSALISDGTTVFKAAGVTSENAIAVVTQAAVQGAIQAGTTVQQAVSAVTPAATSVATSLGLSSADGLKAAATGATAGVLNSGGTLQQAVSALVPVALQTRITFSGAGVGPYGAGAGAATDPLTTVASGLIAGAMQTGMSLTDAAGTVRDTSVSALRSQGLSGMNLMMAGYAVDAGVSPVGATYVPTTSTVPVATYVPTGSNTINQSGGGGGTTGGGTASPAQ